MKIITVSREFGSGGRVIAEALAERFNIPIYDRHLITDIAEKTGLTPEEIEKYNENRTFFGKRYSADIPDSFCMCILAHFRSRPDSQVACRSAQHN